jgi:hypothetical protein
MILEDHMQEKKRKREKQTRPALNTTHRLVGMGHQLSRSTTHKRRQER